MIYHTKENKIDNEFLFSVLEEKKSSRRNAKKTINISLSQLRSQKSQRTRWSYEIAADNDSAQRVTTIS